MSQSERWEETPYHEYNQNDKRNNQKSQNQKKYIYI